MYFLEKRKRVLYYLGYTIRPYYTEKQAKLAVTLWPFLTDIRE